ncbi:zf-HC2 domain-containing protein [Nocardioides albidus]|uniref:Zf-HC2 domain-containing protein n=1 Tax=Nocardioides albidus TaxID=1517589 RepID=A0A5C4VLC9_9ACTN|nr:zf-HC2 domain-containing protein [Nocardioides albidus]TNM36648.1 zf-HC2 domain-containing protein [Nocardioides albidus]
MSTTGWHAPPELLRGYLAGDLDAVAAASVERHVDRCGTCRGSVRPLLDSPALDSPALGSPALGSGLDSRSLDLAWTVIRDRAQAPRLPLLIRLAQQVGLREPTAILLSAAASLRAAWLSGAVVVLGFATIAATLGDHRIWPYLLVAPLIPVLGVAAAYGDADEPFEALAATAPYGRTRLVLLRTLGVIVSTVPVAALLGVLLPGPAWVGVAWLGPALAMIPVLLALAGFIGSRTAGAVVTLLWSGLVLGSVRGLEATWPVAATQQAVYLGLALAALGVIAVRSRITHPMGAAL